MSEPLRVLLLQDTDADAEPVLSALRKAKVRYLSQRVAERADFLVSLQECPPDVVIADDALAHYASLDALRDLHEIRPAACFILIAGDGAVDERITVDAVRAGADDVIARSHLSRLPDAIAAARAVHHQLDKLSERQMEVLRLIARGDTTPEIARRLGLSEKTVQTHRTELMRRLDIHDLVRLVHFAVRVGLVPIRD